MEPIKFKPLLKSTLWGGEKIIPFKHLSTQQQQVGESWEISGVENNETVVAEGIHAGKKLNQVVHEMKEQLVGKENYQRFGDVTLVPALASAYVRLPFGSVMMPVGTFDFGYAFGDDSQMMWKAGGGFDIKLGRYSSILLLSGYQNLKKTGDYVYFRCGLLLEL